MILEKRILEKSILDISGNKAGMFELRPETREELIEEINNAIHEQGNNAD